MQESRGDMVLRVAKISQYHQHFAKLYAHFFLPMRGKQIMGNSQSVHQAFLIKDTNHRIAAISIRLVIRVPRV